jgi:pimeloyl-ACP methyl ester carboxylesterase
MAANAERGAMTTSHFKSSDSTRLAIHRTGSGSPVILLHGLFSSSYMNWIKWGHDQRLADAGFEAIMLDFRVHGESDAPHDPAAYPPGVLLRDLAALVDHLHFDSESYDLVGFSLGARTAIHACATGALQPRRLVACGMGLEGLNDWRKRANFFIRVIDEFDTIGRDDPAYQSRQFMKSQKVDQAAARLLLGAVGDFSATGLANISSPTLVVSGEKDSDNGSAIALAERLPNATYEEIPGGHLDSATKPQLGEAIARFLAA